MGRPRAPLPLPVRPAAIAWAFALCAFALLAVLAPAARGGAILDEEGRIVSLRDGFNRGLALRLTADGQRDPSFDRNGYVQIPHDMMDGYDVEQLSDGQYVILGTGWLGRARLQVLRPDGSLGRVVTLAAGISSSGSLTSLAGGGLLLAYSANEPGVGISSEMVSYFVRLSPDLSVDPSFGGPRGVRVDPSSSYEAPLSGPPVPMPDGRIVAGGFDFLVRLTSGGQLDPTFGDGDGEVEDAPADAVAVQGDGSVLAAQPADPSVEVRRYDVSGTPDESFGGGDGVATAPLGGRLSFRVGVDLSVEAEGIVVAGGSLRCAGGDPIFPNCDSTLGLARLGHDGVLDEAYGGGDGAATVEVAGGVREIELLIAPGRHLIEGGAIPTPRGAAVEASVVVGLRPDGSVDPSFGGGDGVFLPPRWPQRCGDRGSADYPQHAIGTPEADHNPSYADSTTPTFVHGMAGDDVIRLYVPAGDRLCGGAGHDLIANRKAEPPVVEDGSQQAYGQTGNDVIRLGPGDDILSGGPGGDRLKGGIGRDELWGGAGSDRLRSRDGARDLVHCDRGRDVATVDGLDRVFSCERVIRR